MGCDIHGWVEIVTKWDGGDENAHAVVSISDLTEQSYEVFAALFGVRSHPTSREPIAPKRGLPASASKVVKQDFSAWDGHSATWLTWDEILAVNEQDYIETLIAMPDQYRTLRNIIDYWPGWRLLFDLTARLAVNYAPDCIRFVVWFDN